MSSFGTHDEPNLLTYLPDFSVLICKSCQFAIQPSALPSHLLRHRIYRTDRQRLLQELSTLTLLEPEEVPTPAPHSTTLRDLPVHRGFRCLSTGCTHACASQKRMSQHWSEVHGERDSKKVRARSAYLQTFFKGNKILYFEVNGPEGESASAIITTNPMGLILRTNESSESTSPGMSRTPLSPGEMSSEASGDSEFEFTPILNMDELRYLHYYTVDTSRTLTRSEAESAHLWVHVIPGEAFRHPFLMYGVLGLASFHMACNASTASEARIHNGASLRYQSAGMADFRAAMQRPDSENSTALVAFARLIGVQRSTRPQFEDGAFNIRSPQEGLAIIVEFLQLVRGTVETLVSLQDLLPQGSAFVLAEDELERLRQTEGSPIPAPHTTATGSIPPSLLDRLNSLPRRLAAMLPTSMDEDETRSIGFATAALIRSFSRSCTTNDDRALWDGIETWPRTLPNHYLRMLEVGHPAALLVFAHWCLLLGRVEQHHWYLRGQTERLLRIAAANVHGDVQHMVLELLGSE